ncbi:MAG: class I SAM-dependent methyltransferase [Cellulosilyticaceae bacterium]
MSVDHFTGKAEAYAKGRPGYPKEVFEKIIELAPTDAVFADVGAGTGLFTKEIAEYGHTVYAVEPNDDMRDQLTRILKGYKNVMPVAGSAEVTTLPDQSVDIITIAHALHWFNLDTFRVECDRILKPAGRIIVIYNHIPGREVNDFGRQAVDAFFSNPIAYSFENPIHYTREKWLAYINSQDDSPLPSDPTYDTHLSALNEVFDRDSVDGVLRCDRITRIYSERSC